MTAPAVKRIASPGRSDAEAVLHLLRAAFAGMEGLIDPPSSLDRMGWQDIAAKARDEILFCIEEDGVPIACLFASETPDHLYLSKLAVADSHRNRGLARRLLEAAEGHARALGLTSLVLKTRVELTENHAAFARLGFVRTDATAHPGYDRPTSLTFTRPVKPATARPRCGHCLCGRVRWQTDGTQAWAGYCHCESCRRACAAPVTAYLGVPDGHWRWTGATPATFESTPGVRRHFCATCGTPMAYEAEAFPGEIHFHAAALDAPADFTPDFHVNHAEHLPWLTIADDLPRYPGGGNDGEPE
ncbi:hypothetical protein CLV78_101293 [Aliiruegeria haliotis]|uniref:GNAT family N-acetyltransferase n=1 Tax=Aliiruegeria haliotis TaxID=1280846 RepID=A0A2T0RYF4_9RHOB|nr:hypothetical protein CLV78_101293 [Aliiruegeria haliotis]